MSNIEGVQKVVDAYFSAPEWEDYSFSVSSLIDGEQIIGVYAIHKNADYRKGKVGNKIANELNVYWHIKDPKEYSDKEIGLMAAASIETLIGHKKLAVIQ